MVELIIDALVRGIVSYWCWWQNAEQWFENRSFSNGFPCVHVFVSLYDQEVFSMWIIYNMLLFWSSQQPNVSVQISVYLCTGVCQPLKSSHHSSISLAPDPAGEPQPVHRVLPSRPHYDTMFTIKQHSLIVLQVKEMWLMLVMKCSFVKWEWDGWRVNDGDRGRQGEIVLNSEDSSGSWEAVRPTPPT